MNKLTDLFKTFFIIGAFTIGGGYAMLPLFEEEFVYKKKWFTEEDYMNMVTIATSCPGPLAVNSAVYTGYHVAGWKGSLFSVMGVIIPPILIILAIIPFYVEFKELEIVEQIFKGIRPAVVGLISVAVYKMIRGKISGRQLLVPAIAFGIIALFHLDPAIIILLLGVTGFAISKLGEGRS